MEFIIRNYGGQSDKAQVEDIERRCAIGPSGSVFLFTDTMGDLICRIRNCPMYYMLVAEMDKELIGVIQGSIKVVTLAAHDLAKVGFVLGLRVAPNHRRKGVGSSLVRRLEDWFCYKDVDYAYMATTKDNHASVSFFMGKFGYTKFRTPSILVNPVNHDHPLRISSNMEILRLKVDQAESLYRNFMGSSEFFPDDIDCILRNKLSLGTWVAYFKGDSSWDDFGNDGRVPTNWAMLSVWNSGKIFNLRLKEVTFSCLLCRKSQSLIDKLFPCLKRRTTLPDFLNPFGFYFMYGLCHDGPLSGKLVRGLCKFVHNMAAESEDCENIKVVVSEVGGGRDKIKHHIPHWKLLSCQQEDLWCIKALKNIDGAHEFHELTKIPPTRPLFVDPREV